MKGLKNIVWKAIDRIALKLISSVNIKCGSDIKTLNDLLRESSNINGEALHVLHAFRILLHAGKRLGRDFTGKVLEMGGYEHPGLALLFLLHGTEKYYLNNISVVENRMPLALAQTLYVLTDLGGCVEKELFDIVEVIEGTQDVRIIPKFIEVISSLDASRIELPSCMFDFIFSITVLEHVPNTEPFVSKCYDLLRPGGWVAHEIDLRDHDNFNEPIKFLEYDTETFKKVQGNNNRFRRSDHVEVFKKCGFIIDYETFTTPHKTTSSGTTDCFHILSRPVEQVFTSSLDKIDTWVTVEQRSTLSPHFQNYELLDLSITGLGIYAHKDI